MRLASILTLFILNSICLPDVYPQSTGRDRGRDGGDRGQFDRRVGEDRGGPPGGFGSRLDQNGDGRIDQNELNDIPEGFRQAMQSRGVKLKPGLSVEEFTQSMRQQFERSREEGRRPSEERPDERSPGNRSQYRPPAPFRPRRRPPPQRRRKLFFAVFRRARDRRLRRPRRAPPEASHCVARCVSFPLPGLGRMCKKCDIVTDFSGLFMFVYDYWPTLCTSEIFGFPGRPCILL